MAFKASVLLLNHYDQLGPRVELEVKTLREMGYSVCALHWVRVSGSCPPIKQECSIPEIRIRYPAPRGTIRLLPRLPVFYLRAIRRLCTEGIRFDAIHCTHLMLLPLAIYLKMRWDAKAIYDVYEFHLQETAERLPWGLRWLVSLLRSLEKLLVRRVDGVITVDSVGKQLENYYRALQPNTSVLYNVPEIQPKLDPNKLQEIRRRYAGRELIIYVGGLSEAKGALILPKVVCQVMAKRPHTIFLIIGTFHLSKTSQQFWSAVERLGVKEHLEFIPWLPYQDMLHYISLSKVGLAPYQPIPRYYKSSRGNGRKIFTYMQCGIPIVGPQFGEIGRVVQEEGCGLLVDTTDPKAIADAILFLLDNPEEARKMGKRGQAAIRERYNWGVEKVKLLQVYERALCNASTNRRL